MEVKNKKIAGLLAFSLLLGTQQTVAWAHESQSGAEEEKVEEIEENAGEESGEDHTEGAQENDSNELKMNFPGHTNLRGGVPTVKHLRGSVPTVKPTGNTERKPSGTPTVKHLRGSVPTVKPTGNTERKPSGTPTVNPTQKPVWDQFNAVWNQSKAWFSPSVKPAGATTGKTEGKPEGAAIGKTEGKPMRTLSNAKHPALPEKLEKQVNEREDGKGLYLSNRALRGSED